MTERLHFHFSLSCIGEGNGNPLQCSCLENPRDGGAWWVAVYGVAQSRTRLKRLSSSSLSLLQQIFLTQESNRGLLHCRQILYQLSYAATAAKSLQSCPTLCDPIDGSPPGSLVPRILQAKTLEWVAISFSRGSFRPRNRTRVTCIAGRFFTNWTMREAHLLLEV